MNTTTALTPEQERLIAEYFARASDGKALLAECQQSDAVKQELIALAALDRLMQQHYAPSNSIAERVMQGISEQESTNNNVHTWASNQRKPRLLIALAASVLLCISAVLLVITQQPEAIARVTNIAGIDANTLKLNQGVSGRINIAQGFSELTLSNGVVLIVEAPARLNIVSADRVILEQGTLVAKVPPNATGFKVDTPSAEIIDLGTVFGVSVSDNGDSRLHVIEGEVKARASKDQDYELLTTNQARHYDQHQQARVIESSPELFMRALPGQSASKPNYLHWRFDEINHGQIAEHGNGIAGKNYPASDQSIDQVIQLTQGKFGQAIALDGKHNWLETYFPGIADSNPRTVAFWVKAPADFSTDYAYGIVSWGLHSSPNAAWQISTNPETIDGPLGRLRIGTYYGQVVGNTDLRDDQWHHVAVVLYGGDDADISTHVLLYIDGKLETTTKKSIGRVSTELDHPKSKTLTIGRNLGYITEHTHIPQKFFKGVVDEMYVFDVALSHEQVQRLMVENEVL